MRPGENPYIPQANYICDAEELLAVMDVNDVEIAVLMSGGETACGKDPVVTNEQCVQICKKAPGRLHWMCNIDARDATTVAQRLETCRMQGAVGVGELAVNEWLDSAICRSVLDAAEQLHLPVVFHMSPEPGFNYGVCDRPGLPLLEQALKTHPRLTLVGHSQPFWIEISADAPTQTQERNGIGSGPVVRGGRVEQLMDRYENLYGDLSAYSAYCALTRDEEYGLWFLHRYADRLFFATDCLNRYTVPPLGKQLEAWMQSGRLSGEDYEKICRKNAERVYGL